MNTVVDLVAEVVLKEIKETFNKTGEISDHLLSALDDIFGPPVLPALNLVDRKAVTVFKSPQDNYIYQVCSGSGKAYICPSSLSFCPCLSFKFGVLKRRQIITCKHILAIHLCKSMNQCKEEEITEDQLSILLFNQ